MSGGSSAADATRPKRSDARRNERSLLDAAAAVFAKAGVDAPVREIASAAGVGMGTIYRHFPTRAELIIAVYRHQVEACADAAPRLIADHDSPYDALVAWIDLFVEFLVTKHGLATVMQGDAQFQTLHDYFLDRLVPACTLLLRAAAGAGEIDDDVDAYDLMRAVGNLCVGATDTRYHAHRMVRLLVAGLRRSAPGSD